MTYTVKQLADLAHVSVRTLHYYDEIGLLKPSDIAKNGYRLYSRNELLLLQQILFFKELDFPLEEIKKIITDSNFDIEEALKEQKNILNTKRKRIDTLINTIDKTLTSMKNTTTQSDSELYDPFKDDDVSQYQDEVEERWGQTDAYKQSMERVSKLTKQEMEEMKENSYKHTQAIAAVMEKGIENPNVQALIKQSHEGINFFYDCSLEMFENLGEIYVSDPRFTAYYDNIKPGLAEFMRNAIKYYCNK